MASINNGINWEEVHQDLENALGKITSNAAMAFLDERGVIEIHLKKDFGGWAKKVLFFKDFLNRLEDFDLKGYRHIQEYEYAKAIKEEDGRRVSVLSISLKADFDFDSYRSPEKFMMECALRGEKIDEEHLVIAYFIWLLENKSIAPRKKDGGEESSDPYANLAGHACDLFQIDDDKEEEA